MELCRTTEMKRFSGSCGRQTTTTTTTTHPKSKRDKLLESLRLVELAVIRAKQPKVTLRKEEDEIKEGKEKKGNNVTGNKIDIKNQEEVTKEKEREDSHNVASTNQELSDDEDDEEDEDEDDIEETSEIPDELNRQANRIFVTLLKKNEEDLEKKDENLIARLQELEKERIKILLKGYQYSFTQWVERKCEMSVPEMEEKRRREELKEQGLEKEERKKAKKFKKQRKFLEKELTRGKELMQRGGNKEDKEVTEEEGEGRGTIKEKDKESNRKQTEQMVVAEEEEKRRSNQEGKYYRGVQEEKVMKEEEEKERISQRMDQKRKSKEVKNKNPVEREKGVEKEAKADKKKDKKMKIAKLDIRQKKDMTEHDLEEGEAQPLQEEEKKETKVKQKVEKDRAFREAAGEWSPEGALRTQQEEGGGGRLVSEARRRFHEASSQVFSGQGQAASGIHFPRRTTGMNKDTRPGGYLTQRSQTEVGRVCQHHHLTAARRISLLVFVTGIPQGTKPDHLRVTMEQFGAVAYVNQAWGVNYAFVCFEEKDGSEAALHAGTVSLPGGRAVIKPYRSRKDRRSGDRCFPLAFQNRLFRPEASRSRVTASRACVELLAAPGELRGSKCPVGNQRRCPSATQTVSQLARAGDRSQHSSVRWR